MDKEKALKLLSYWKKRLELQDWKIILDIDQTPEDMKAEDTDGECEYQDVNRTAVIRILDKKYYGDRILLYDFEQILVHELLHLKFALLDDSKNPIQNRVVHNLVGSLSRALTFKDGEDK